jgi:ArsR family transcriptional regulator, arsenate/arsenite/antimonite-responsive transcriptional repressor
MNTPRSAPTASTTAALTAAQDAAQDAASTTAAQTAIDASCCGESSKPQSPLPPEPRLNLPAPEVGEVVASAALLADRTRAGILRMLADGPMCVCEMAAALGERQNNVSNHLARLREAGLVRAVRHSGDARWMFYERDDERCAATAAALTELLR